MKKKIIAFLSSSYFSIITFAYLSFFNTFDIDMYFPYDKAAMIVPFIYGLFGMICFEMVRIFGDYAALLVGGALGLLFSVIGRFVYNLPTKMFNIKKEQKYIVHIIATVLYGLIFYFGVLPVLKMI